MKVNIELCVYGTVRIRGTEQKSAVYFTKNVEMPALPAVGTRLLFLESQEMRETSFLSGTVKFISWDECEPDLFCVNAESSGSHSEESRMDYLDTSWFIKQMKQIGWFCDQEGD
jgi:hypothetical protein